MKNFFLKLIIVLTAVSTGVVCLAKGNKSESSFEAIMKKNVKINTSHSEAGARCCNKLPKVV